MTLLTIKIDSKNEFGYNTEEEILDENGYIKDKITINVFEYIKEQLFTASEDITIYFPFLDFELIELNDDDFVDKINNVFKTNLIGYRTDRTSHKVDKKRLQDFLELNPPENRFFSNINYSDFDLSRILMADLGHWYSGFSVAIGIGSNSDNTLKSFLLAYTTDDDLLVINPKNNEIIENLSGWNLDYFIC